MDNSRVGFSIIIPTLNEESTIGRCIAMVRTLEPEVEIIVADGGSTDRTVIIANEEKVIVCQAQQGRGRQCNAGAKLASGTVLIFLHSDTELPADAFSRLEEIFRDEKAQTGTFRLNFDVKHWLLDLYAQTTRLPFVRFGDQGIVVRKPFFERLGGFPELNLFEDLDFIRKAGKYTYIHRFPLAVTTSARRFIRNGILKHQLRNTLYMLLYFLGVSPDYLARRYLHGTNCRRSASLIFFTRFPRPGSVKTRLATATGNRFAADFYRICAEHSLKESRKIPNGIRKYVFCADKSDLPQVRRWLGRGLLYASQSEGDLGQRLEHAFDTVFGHGAGKAITVATDVPELSAEILDEAVSALDNHDIVLGPSHDGGYYLLGMKAIHYEFFKDIPWSTEHVSRKTLNVAEELGFTVHKLPSLMDIDTEEDLRSWLSTARSEKECPIREMARQWELKTAS
jgi:rSAM/selenodomain-associated transferase 2/rSAM/selenodomain-associated transferase 1